MCRFALRCAALQVEGLVRNCCDNGESRAGSFTACHAMAEGGLSDLVELDVAFSTETGCGSVGHVEWYCNCLLMVQVSILDE